MESTLGEELKRINTVIEGLQNPANIIVQKIQALHPHLTLVVNNGKSIGRKRRKK